MHSDRMNREAPNSAIESSGFQGTKLEAGKPPTPVTPFNIDEGLAMFAGRPDSSDPPEPPETRFLLWVLLGSRGLRAGWSVLLFLALTLIFLGVFDTFAAVFTQSVWHTNLDTFSAATSLVSELAQVLSIMGAVTVCALVERRSLLDYNLRGKYRMRFFFAGLASGFVMLSALLGTLYAGHWLTIGPIALSGTQVFTYGAIWGASFLLTGFAEEGSMRCYLQFTLTRGTNYWWALGSVAAICLSGFAFQKGEGIWGVYTFAALGVIPCLILQLSKTPSSGFWQAAWVTSTFFGFIHTGNDGETLIGVFSTAAIGLVFCVSVRLTGSAWWAIGFHAAWDWAQTFFYGTPDSGFPAKEHLVSTSPLGAAIWSGGPAGPEGSLLLIPVILLTILALIAACGDGRRFRTPGTTYLPGKA